MTTSIKWYDEAKTIIIIHLTAGWTWDVYHKLIDQVVVEAKTVQHRVDLIIQDESGLPKGNPIPHLKTGSLKIVSCPNFKLTLIAGKRGVISFPQSILNVISRAFMKPAPNMSAGALVFVANLEEAVSRIEKDRLAQAV